MIKLIRIITENYLPEYSQEERQKMGIPSGAVSRGGKWYQGDKYIGQVKNGKFVAATAGEKNASSTPRQKTTPPSKGEKNASSTPRQKTTPPSKITKDTHKDPKVHQRVAATMNKFKINQDSSSGYGEFAWVDSPTGGYYEYDDGEGGYDYYAEVKPLDNDQYEVTTGGRGGRDEPVIVQGLKGVKKHLENPQEPSSPKGISKNQHKDPKVHQRVADAMSGFKINQDSSGGYGAFEWVDDENGGYYNYDDGEGGYDYAATVTPLDNDEYEVRTGGRGGLDEPIRVKGLKGVKKHLEDTELKS